MWEFITSDIALEIFLLLLSALGALGGKLVHRHVRWVRAQTALYRLGEHSHRAVLSTYQTFVRILREGREDGQLTPDEKEKAFARALANLKTYCGWDDLLWLLGVEGAERALADSIEEHVAMVNRWELEPGEELADRITVPLPPPRGPASSSNLRS